MTWLASAVVKLILLDVNPLCAIAGDFRVPSGCSGHVEAWPIFDRFELDAAGASDHPDGRGFVPDGAAGCVSESLKTKLV